MTKSDVMETPGIEYLVLGVEILWYIQMFQQMGTLAQGL